MSTFFSSLYYFIFFVIVVFTLLLLSTFFPIKDWYQAKVVLSGSMEPAIPVGSLVVIKPAPAYIPGDVITFGPDTKNSIPVTHRIVGTEETGNFKTKGDANEGVDAGVVNPKSVIGKVVFHIPYFGFFLDFAKTERGFWFLVIIPCALVALFELMRAVREWFFTRRPSSDVSFKL